MSQYRMQHSQQLASTGSQFQQTAPSSASMAATAKQHSAGGSTMRPFGVGSITERLQNLSTRFDGFHQELDFSCQEKRHDDQRRLAAVQGQLSVLRDALELESKNRAASIQALQAWLDERVCQWAREVEAPLTARLTQLSTKLDAAVSRIDVLEKQQVANRELIPKLVQLKGAELQAQIAECAAAIAQEQALREEREKKVFVRIQDMGARLREQLASERTLAESRAREVKEQLAVEIAARERADVRTAARLDEETLELRRAAQAEAEERALADEALVQTLVSATQTLQTGIKIAALQ